MTKRTEIEAGNSPRNPFIIMTGLTWIVGALVMLLSWGYAAGWQVLAAMVAFAIWCGNIMYRGARIERMCLAAGAILLASGTVAAQKPLILFELTFPDRIAGAQRTEPQDFESKTPGLGYSVEYQLKDWKIDVYIYDLRRTDISDNAQSALVTGQLAQATDDIFNTSKQVQIRLKYAVLDDAARVRFLCSSFELVDRQGGDRDSYLCVTSAKNKFIKFRLTTDRRAGSEAAANAFVRAWMKVLWPGA